MKRSWIVAVVLGIAAIAALAQRRRLSYEDDDISIPKREAEFHFIRAEYADLPGYSRGFGFVSRSGRGAGWWSQDWPDADNHFTVGIQRLTRIDTGDPRHLSFTDQKLFDYPWIYATQTGSWDLSNAEVEKLREYLLKG